MSTIYDIVIPDLGGDTDVDLIDVMVSVGDVVEVEDGLITLETEKASMDVPTTHAGVVKEIFLKEGMKVNSGDLIAKVEAVEEDTETKEEVLEAVEKETPPEENNSNLPKNRKSFFDKWAEKFREFLDNAE